MGSQPLNHPDVCPSCDKSLWDEIMRPGNSEMVDITIKFRPEGAEKPLLWECPHCGHVMQMWDATEPAHYAAQDYLLVLNPEDAP